MSGLKARIGLKRSSSFQLDLEISIPPGVTVALLGPNGAGKSTAISAIAGLLPIARGRISLDGTVLDDPGTGVFVPVERRNIGVVFQDYLLFPHLSVLGNVTFGLRSRGVDGQRADSRARDWLARLELDGLERRRPRDLSGGQRQKVALARALAIEPDLLLLDEPLASLDVTTRSSLRRTLSDHLDSFAGPRLLITHDPVEAFLLADEIHVIENGSVTQSGDADDIRLRPRTSYAADLAGSNLLDGVASFGRVDVGTHVLAIADRDLEGEVLLTVHPTAISVHRSQPEGSPRNAWQTTIERIERLGDRTRLRTGAPLPLTVEITTDALDALSLEPGDVVWLSIKATEIRTQPESVR